MNDLIHNIVGDTAVKIAASIENQVRAEKLQPNDRLPSVRALADHCGVSPATVAAAYKTLQDRGFVITDGRRGTRVSFRPHATRRADVQVPPQARNLADGNPDPALLPGMGDALLRIDPSIHLYGRAPQDANLLALVRRDFDADGVRRGDIGFVSGAVDGIERVLTAHLRPGDRVAVEDPSFGNIIDLVTSRGMSLVPVAVDGEGLLPDALEHACRQRIGALILTPRAQNPTGAALSATRARALRRVLARHEDVVVIEDDHGALTSDTPLEVLHTKQNRWAYVRSFSKGLNPDLRLAAITGDDDTMTRLLDRMVLCERWVSHILQRIAYALLSDSGVQKQLAQAATTYAKRRESLKAALAARGFEAMASSGYNVWVPLEEETPVVQGLLARGFAVSAGERFRIQSPSAIRVTCATLQPAEATAFAEALASVFSTKRRTGNV
ncbi:MAG: aminotransferase class I/II-fold pyridoxal phosphate-dependent enzyme [Phycisphaerae bacterium]